MCAHTIKKEAIPNGDLSLLVLRIDSRERRDTRYEPAKSLPELAKGVFETSPFSEVGAWKSLFCVESLTMSSQRTKCPHFKNSRRL